MNNSVLILGGYGNFGKKIAHALVKAGIAVIIAGRDERKATQLTRQLLQQYPNISIASSAFDVNKALPAQLESLKPAVVINTCGPFQTADYSVASACIAHKVHYIDLSDGRDFVTGITELDAEAKKMGVLVVSGASTVPGLSSAVLEHYKSGFSTFDSLKFGISPGAKAPRGLATTQAILTYLGKPLKPCPGSHTKRYGWQDIYRQPYPELGKRWMANCDIPDLDLFPEKYGIKTIQFSAGMESTLLHLGMWLLSWSVRLGLPLTLEKHAALLLRLSTLFDSLGTPHGGMHMLIKGTDTQGKQKEIQWFIVARDGDGPHIPTIPSIILAKKLCQNAIQQTGAIPCIGLVTLEEYLAELNSFAVRTFVHEKFM